MTPQLTYYDLGPRVVAFSTTRHGGVSTGSYGTFNINGYCGDQPEAVAENRRLLATELPVADVMHIVLPHQVHDSVVKIIDEASLGRQDRRGCASACLQPTVYLLLYITPYTIVLQPCMPAGVAR